MEIKLESLNALFNRLKGIGFFERIFSWNKVQSLIADAASELGALQQATSELKSQSAAKENQLSDLRKDIEVLKIAESGLQARIAQQSIEIDSLREGGVKVKQLYASEQEARKQKEQVLTDLQIEKSQISERYNHLSKEIQELKTELAGLHKNEEFRKTEHAEAVASLKAIQQDISDERRREQELIRVKDQERIDRLKATWSDHQLQAQQYIKAICGKHTIEYVDQVPFKGTPDNTIRIAGEYIVFDAKSPAGEDLNNFPLYIKTQAEAAKKYASQDDVRREIFFVVPSNTLEALKHFVYPMADYTVYVISLDTLEPIILSLKKIEEYEFAEELTPEERSNICRILGKFAHLTKRRIQVDSFFAKQAIELGYAAESSLPAEILEEMLNFERSDKLNPPQEKRTKLISIKDLEKETTKLDQEAKGRGINVDSDPLADKINQFPLFGDEEKKDA
ncbi:MAG: hypothetical protein ACK5AO_02620 [bacterium]|jgi:predicted  nucleic acid-binding Zn-ribbon protein